MLTPHHSAKHQKGRGTKRLRSSSNQQQHDDGTNSGYNSGDEHTLDRRPFDMQWTEEEYEENERKFEKKINKKGWVIKKMAEDGACLFRAVADQIYGDQEMHSVLRKLCIDYIAKNSDYFSQYVTEDFGEYLKRKSLDHSHGNHIEIQAMSEMFNRPIEVYHYSSDPINIFHGLKNDSEPIRLSYHRSVHYNSIVNPFKATIGVGLGLPEYEPGLADNSLLENAMRISDWEATNDAIEQQVARESYFEWLRENESRMLKKFRPSSPCSPSQIASSSNSHTASSVISPPSPLASSSHHHASCSGYNNSNSNTNQVDTSPSGRDAIDLSDKTKQGGDTDENDENKIDSKDKLDNFEDSRGANNADSGAKTESKKQENVANS